MKEEATMLYSAERMVGKGNRYHESLLAFPSGSLSLCLEFHGRIFFFLSFSEHEVLSLGWNGLME